MAEVFRPVYYVDPATGKLVSKKACPHAVKRKSKRWRIRYYDTAGVRHVAKGYSDRRATEALATELEKQAARGAQGYPDATHAKRPLAEHAADYRRYLEAKGNTPAYVDKTLARLQAVLDGCRFIRTVDIQPSRVVEFLAELRRDNRHGDKTTQGKSIRTANYYLAAMKGFTRWLWKDKRIPVDPLAGLSRLANVDTDIRHARRDFTAEEFTCLLETARNSDTAFRGLTGRDRYHVYLTAAATGFRASELASLTPESFDLDSTRATATVEAGYSKNRKAACQPLPATATAALREYLAGQPVGELLWPGTWRIQAFLMIQADLEAARQAWIEQAPTPAERTAREASDFLSYRDSEGRFADFHSLRHSYISMVGRTGAAPKVHQDLARHSTYALTGKYTHSRLYDLAAAVAELPIVLPGDRATAQAVGVLRATGTDGNAGGGESAAQAQNCLGPNLGPRPDNSGDSERQTETEESTVDDGMSQAKNPGKQAISAVFQGSDIRPTPPGFEPGMREPKSLVSIPQSPIGKGVRGSDRKPLARGLAHESQNCPDLARLIEAWPNLPDTARRMILAAVEAAGAGG